MYIDQLSRSELMSIVLIDEFCLPFRAADFSLRFLLFAAYLKFICEIAANTLINAISCKVNLLIMLQYRREYLILQLLYCNAIRLRERTTLNSLPKVICWESDCMSRTTSESSTDRKSRHARWLAAQFGERAPSLTKARTVEQVCSCSWLNAK